MMAIVNRVKKGDVVAVRRRHSSFSRISGVKRWETWTVAVVDSATRDGAVKRVLLYPLAVPEFADPANVLTLHDAVRDAGRRLWERKTHVTEESPSQETLRAALRTEAGIADAA
jgi:hypothetical protein